MSRRRIHAPTQRRSGRTPCGLALHLSPELQTSSDIDRVTCLRCRTAVGPEWRFRQRKHQSAKIAAGICRICTEPLARSGLCERHYEQHAIRTRNTYRRKHGMPPIYVKPRPNRRRAA